MRAYVWLRNNVPARSHLTSTVDVLQTQMRLSVSTEPKAYYKVLRAFLRVWKHSNSGL